MEQLICLVFIFIILWIMGFDLERENKKELIPLLGLVLSLFFAYFIAFFIT